MKTKIITSILVIPLILGVMYQATAQQEDLIPDWIETTAGFWVEGHVGDQEFVDAMKHLIEEGIIVIYQDDESIESEISELKKENMVLTNRILKLEDENSELKKEIAGNQAADCTLRGEGVDLYGCDLRGTDLRLADLSNANLSGANLVNAVLNGADLTNTNLKGCRNHPICQ